MSEDKTINLSLSIDLFLREEDREQYQAILNSIRRYRASCRAMFAALTCSQSAGASIHENGDGQLSVKPDNAKAKQILELATGKSGKALAYELRDIFFAELYPEAMSFVWDSARRDVVTVWNAKDPERTRASRGWLALQGARNLAQFNWRGIGFPVATARPKLAGHSLFLKWDHGIGQIEFQVGKLDGGRHHIWKALRDKQDGWELGTVFLNERDGKLRASLSYSRPARESSVDPERTCSITFGEDEENFLKIIGPGDEFDTISATEAIAWLKQMEARKIALENRRKACGNPRRPWGHRKGWLAAQDVLSRLTAQRENGAKDRNHAWTRRIVSRAVSWRCGKIVVGELPENLFGKPWGWNQFKECLKYKCQDAGIVLG